MTESIVAAGATPAADYDVARVRADVPALRSGIAFFDGPGGTQTPAVVADAVANALKHPLSNRGSITLGEQNAEAAVHDARHAMADYVNGDPAAIVFGRSATQINYDMSRTLAKSWGPGDEIVVTRLDHDSNVRPWVQAAEAVGATVRWAVFDPATSELTAADIAAVVTERTRLVAVTAASNLIGTRPPVAEIAAIAHAVGALVYVDGVHYAAHERVDIGALGADFFVCSPYKFLGPHLGVLASRPEVLEPMRNDKLLPATNVVPERFEFGTLPYELLAGTAAAVDYLAGLDAGATGSRRARLDASFAALEHHEDVLRARIQHGLAELPEITVWSRASLRTPTLLLGLPGRAEADAYRFLAERGVAAPAGSFYALEASRHLGLGDEGALRVGLAPYNDESDVDRLLEALAAFLRR